MTDPEKPKLIKKAIEKLRGAARKSESARRGVDTFDILGPAKLETTTRIKTEAKKPHGSVIAKEIVGNRQMSEGMMKIYENHIFENEPKANHSQLFVGKAIAEDIRHAVKVGRVTAAEAFRELAEIAKVYSENPQAAREFVRVAREMDQQQGWSPEQTYDYAQVAARQAGVAVSNNSDYQNRTNTLINEMNNEFTNEKPPKAANLLTTYQQAVDNPILAHEAVEQFIAAQVIDTAAKMKRKTEDRKKKEEKLEEEVGLEPEAALEEAELSLKEDQRLEAQAEIKAKLEIESPQTPRIVYEGQGRPQKGEPAISNEGQVTESTIAADLRTVGVTPDKEQEFFDGLKAAEFGDVRTINRTLGEIFRDVNSNPETQEAFVRVATHTVDCVANNKDTKEAARELVSALSAPDADQQAIVEKVYQLNKESLGDNNVDYTLIHLNAAALKKLNPTLGSYIDRAIRQIHERGMIEPLDFSQLTNNIRLVLETSSIQEREVILGFYGSILRYHNSEVAGDYLEFVEAVTSTESDHARIQAQKAFERITKKLGDSNYSRLLLQAVSNVSQEGQDSWSWRTEKVEAMGRPRRGDGTRKPSDIYTDKSDADAALDLYEKRQEKMTIKQRDKRLDEIALRAARSTGLTQTEFEEFMDRLNTLQADVLQEQEAQGARLRKEGKAAEHEFAQNRYREIETKIKEKLEPTAPDVIAYDEAKNIINKALEAVSANELRQKIRELQKIHQDLTEKINAGSTTIGTYSINRSDIDTISEVIVLLRERADHFKFVIDPLIQARDEYVSNNNQLHQMLHERGAGIGADFKIRDKIRTSVTEALSARSYPEGQEALKALNDTIENLALSADERVLLNRIMPLVRRQVYLLRHVVSPEQVTDYYYQRCGLDNYHVRRVEELMQVEDLLDKLREAESEPDKQALWDKIWQDTVETMNILLKSSDATPTLDFSQSFGALIEEPVFKQLVNYVQRARENYMNLTTRDASMKITVQAWRPDANGRLVKQNVDLGEALELLYNKILADRQLREYTHNVYYIILTRGSLEDLAKYSRSIRANTVEMAMLGEGEDIIQSATRLYEMETMKLIADNNWILPSDLFTSGSMNDVDKLVEEALVTMYRTQADDWQVQRAKTVGRGVSMGVTLAALEWMVQADPPRGNEAFVGYLGDSLASALNWTRHHPFKWWSVMRQYADGNLEATHPFARLFYTKIDKAQFFKGWHQNRLIQEIKDHVLDTRTHLNQREDTPYVQMSNFFHVGGILYRRGWRFTSAFQHHFTPRANQLLYDQSRNFLWENLDVDQTWVSLSKAGSGALYWFAGELSGARGRGFLAGQTILGIDTNSPSFAQDLKLLVIDYALERNPIKFIRLDPTQPEKVGHITERSQEASDSLRMQTLARLGIGGFPKNLIDQWERDCALITQELVRLQKRSITDLTVEETQNIRNLLGNTSRPGPDGRSMDISRFDEAIAYWQAVQYVVRNQHQVVIRRGRREDGDIWRELFAKQELPYQFGSDDLDHREVKWTQAGNSVINRSLSDDFIIYKTAIEPMNEINTILEQVAVEKKFDKLIEHLEKTHAVIRNVHGYEVADELVYKEALLFIRYFDKQWSAQLPFGAGTLMGLRLRVHDRPELGISLSQQNQGPDAWAWDEQTTRTFINQIMTAGMLKKTGRVPGMRAGKFTGKRLIAEAGARMTQVSADMLRSASPYFAILMGFSLFSFMQKQLEEKT